MAEVAIEIAGRTHKVMCRDGEEAHLRRMALIVDGKAREAGRGLGAVNETRQLLFAALLLADELADLRDTAAAAESGAGSDAALAETLERLAGRLETLRAGLEGAAPTP
ncbi:cell division protein ZapA [Sphingomonas zeicaulis]|uniref:cell division protein ZapA n=1 Tax=Sphingomonas zeicaulis TaxID=1632740 RepID=UPI003D1E696F